MTDYAWAVNKTKLKQAMSDVEKSGKTVTEENVKAAYEARAGLLASEKAKQDETPRPRASANKGQKVSVKE